MVEGLGGTTAVLTGMAITPENRAPGHRDDPTIWHFDVAVETHHGRQLDGGRFRGPDLVTTDHHGRFVAEDEHDRPSLADDRQWLEARIEDKGSCHFQQRPTSQKSNRSLV
jgi:hypothetical protein